MFFSYFYNSSSNQLDHSKTYQQFDFDIFEAAFIGNVSAINDALNNGAKINATCDNADGSIFNEYTPLLISVFAGRLDATKTLIEQGANIHAVTETKQNVLHLAATNGHKDIIEYLFQNKPEEILYILNNTDKNGNTPLHLSTFNKDSFEVTKQLLELGSDFNLKNLEDKSVLECARNLGHEQIVKVIESHIIKELISNRLISIRKHISEKANQGFNFSDSWLLNKAISTHAKISLADGTEKLSPTTESDVWKLLDNTKLSDLEKYLQIKKIYGGTYQAGWFIRSDNTLQFRNEIKDMFEMDTKILESNQISLDHVLIKTIQFNLI